MGLLLVSALTHERCRLSTLWQLGGGPYVGWPRVRDGTTGIVGGESSGTWSRYAEMAVGL